MKFNPTKTSYADNTIRHSCEVSERRSHSVENVMSSDTARGLVSTSRRGRDKAFIFYSPTALLDRRELALALSALGFPVTASTLATKATRGGGPKYQPWGGRRVLYVWGDAVDWAEARLGTVRDDTSTGWKPHRTHQHGGSKDER